MVLVSIFAILSPGFCNAQKVLQLERKGSLHTTKIMVGETITFKLFNDDKGWYERTIFDIEPNRNQLNLEGTMISIDSISIIRFDKRPTIPFILGTTLQAGGANIILLDLYYGVVQNREIEARTFITGAANIGVGTLIKKIFPYKKFRVGKSKRLRLLDLNFGDPVVPVKT